jgi:hypothetical protein
VSGCVSESEIESRNRDGRGICRVWSASVCFAPLRGRFANGGRVALGCFVRVLDMVGKGQTDMDR